MASARLRTPVSRGIHLHGGDEGSKRACFAVYRLTGCERKTKKEEEEEKTNGVGGSLLNGEDKIK